MMLAHHLCYFLSVRGEKPLFSFAPSLSPRPNTLSLEVRNVPHREVGFGQQFGHFKRFMPLFPSIWRSLRLVMSAGTPGKAAKGKVCTRSAVPPTPWLGPGQKPFPDIGSNLELWLTPFWPYPLWLSCYIVNAF